MTYRELKEKHQAEVNAFPFGFAFSNEQFADMMNKWGLNAEKKEDLHKIVSIGAGGYVRKTDLDSMHDMFNRQDTELKEFRKEQKNLVEEIYYEMNNHEYGYTRDLEDTLNCLGKTYEDYFKDENFKKAWKKAEKKCFEDFNKCN